MTATAPDLPPATIRKLAEIFAAHPDLAKVILYGSRATGKANPRSDIDLAAVGMPDALRLGRLALDIEDPSIPQKCDLQAYESIRYAPLKRHIDAFGITIYESGEGASAAKT